MTLAPGESSRMGRLDASGVGYIESTMKVRLARTGVVCDAVTGRELARKGTVANGSTRVSKQEEGGYIIGNEVRIYSVKFLHGGWYAGDLSNALEDSA